LHNPGFIKQDKSKEEEGFDEDAMKNILEQMQEASPDTRKHRIGEGLADEVS